MSATYLEELEQEFQQTSNYVKFQDGETKTLKFTNNREHNYPNKDEKFGKRGRFLVDDYSSAMKPLNNLIWDASPRWTNIIIKLLKEYEENAEVYIEITRHGSGTNTWYQIQQSPVNH